MMTEHDDAEAKGRERHLIAKALARTIATDSKLPKYQQSPSDIEGMRALLRKYTAEHDQYLDEQKKIAAGLILAPAVATA